MELYNPNIAYVNINDGYNNVEDDLELNSENLQNYMDNNLKGNLFKSPIDFIKFHTINANGYVTPVKKWLIDTNYHINKSIFFEDLKLNKEPEPENKTIGVVTPSGEEYNPIEYAVPESWESIASSVEEEQISNDV